MDGNYLILYFKIIFEIHCFNLSSNISSQEPFFIYFKKWPESKVWEVWRFSKVTSHHSEASHCLQTFCFIRENEREHQEISHQSCLKTRRLICFRNLDLLMFLSKPQSESSACALQHWHEAGEWIYGNSESEQTVCPDQSRAWIIKFRVGTWR